MICYISYSRKKTNFSFSKIFRNSLHQLHFLYNKILRKLIIQIIFLNKLITAVCKIL